MKQAFSIALVASLATLTSAADAQPRSKADVDRAEQLFRDAKALMSDGRFAEACPKLRESQNIDPATGTLLALAICHQSEGRLGTAYREFKEVLPATMAEKRRDRENLVQARLKDLGARAPKLLVVLEGEGARDPNVIVRIDGDALAKNEIGAEIAVDAGDHVVEATSGARGYRETVSVVGERAVRRVVVSLVGAAPVAAAEPPPASVQAADAPSGRGPSDSATSAVGLGLIGVGVVGIGVGAFFGVRAIQKSDEAKSLCDPAACTDSRALGINDDAKSAATISTISIALGAVAAVGGVILWRVSKNTTVVPSAAVAAGHVALGAAARF